MVRSDHAVSTRFGSDGTQLHEQSGPVDKSSEGDVGGEEPPARAREVVNDMVLGLSIGGLIGVAFYAL